MAKIHGSAGQYPRTQAERILLRGMQVVLMAMLVYGGFVGFFLAHGRAVWAWVGLVCVPLLLLAAERLAQPWLKRARQEQRKYERGASGEELVGMLLEDLPDDWHVFHSMQINEGSDLDHVVVGPGGIYYISTKNHRGLISTGPDGRLLYNNQPFEEPTQARRQGMDLSNRLSALLAGKAWVNVILAIPQAWIDGRGQAKNGVQLVHRENLLYTLKSAPPRLSPEQVSAHVKAMEMLFASARQVKQAAREAGIGGPPDTALSLKVW